MEPLEEIEGYENICEIFLNANMIEGKFEIITGNDAIWAVLTGKEGNENGRTNEEGTDLDTCSR